MKPTIIIGIKRWIAFVSVACIAAVFCSWPLAAYLHRPVVVQVPPPPPPPPPCGDVAFMLANWTHVNCDRRAHLVIVSHDIATCICDAREPSR